MLLQSVPNWPVIGVGIVCIASYAGLTYIAGLDERRRRGPRRIWVEVIIEDRPRDEPLDLMLHPEIYRRRRSRRAERFNRVT